MNSRIGTKNMAKISLSGEEICRIIKQCQDSGVENFTYLDLTLKFHSRRNESADQLGQASDHVTKPTVVSGYSEAQDKIDAVNSDTFDDAEEAQLLIDDPAAFEKFQIDRHIERARRDETA